MRRICTQPYLCSKGNNVLYNISVTTIKTTKSILTDKIKEKHYMINHLRYYIPPCMSTYNAQPPYNISSKSLAWLRTGCADTVLTCKTLKLDYLLLKSSKSNYIPSCTSTYNAKPFKQNSIKTHRQIHEELGLHEM